MLIHNVVYAVYVHLTELLCAQWIKKDAKHENCLVFASFMLMYELTRTQHTRLIRQMLHDPQQSVDIPEFPCFSDTIGLRGKICEFKKYLNCNYDLVM